MEGYMSNGMKQSDKEAKLLKTLFLIAFSALILLIIVCFHVFKKTDDEKAIEEGFKNLSDKKEAFDNAFFDGKKWQQHKLETEKIKEQTKLRDIELVCEIKTPKIQIKILVEASRNSVFCLSTICERIPSYIYDHKMEENSFSFRISNLLYIVDRKTNEITVTYIKPEQAMHYFNPPPNSTVNAFGSHDGYIPYSQAGQCSISSNETYKKDLEEIHKYFEIANETWSNQEKERLNKIEEYNNLPKKF